MDKKIAGLLGAAAALTTMSAAQSAVAEPVRNKPPSGYRDLLEPVPDALNALKADDAGMAAAKTQGGERVAQYYYHHHHHHRYYGGGYYGGDPHGCPPGYSLQGGNCAPYRGPQGGGWNTYNGCPPGYTIQGANCAPYRGH
jgi:opacity protein-like surface antigen